MQKFLKNLLAELLLNGKMLVGLIIVQFSNYPGIVAAAQELLATHSKESAIKLLGEILLVVGGIFRAGKIFKVLMTKQSL